jgi:hypothetical protein
MWARGTYLGNLADSNLIRRIHNQNLPIGLSWGVSDDRGEVWNSLSQIK